MTCLGLSIKNLVSYNVRSECTFFDRVYTYLPVRRLVCAYQPFIEQVSEAERLQKFRVINENDKRKYTCGGKGNAVGFYEQNWKI